MWRILLFAVIGAIGFRLRGSALFHEWTGRGATTARIVCWAIPIGAMTALTTPAPWWVAIAAGVGAWVGCLPPWWHSLTLGRDPAQGPYHEQALRHAARGMIWVAPIGLVFGLAGLSWWPVLAAGLACWPAYEIGYRIRPQAGTEIGEFLFGAVIGAAIGASG